MESKCLTIIMGAIKFHGSTVVLDIWVNVELLYLANANPEEWHIYNRTLPTLVITSEDNIA